MRTSAVPATGTAISTPRNPASAPSRICTARINAGATETSAPCTLGVTRLPSICCATTASPRVHSPVVVPVAKATPTAGAHPINGPNVGMAVSAPANSARGTAPGTSIAVSPTSPIAVRSPTPMPTPRVQPRSTRLISWSISRTSPCRSRSTSRAAASTYCRGETATNAATTTTTSVPASAPASVLNTPSARAASAEDAAGSESIPSGRLSRASRAARTVGASRMRASDSPRSRGAPSTTAAAIPPRTVTRMRPTHAPRGPPTRPASHWLE